MRQFFYIVRKFNVFIINVYKEKLLNEITNLDNEAINKVIDLLLKSRDEDRQVFIMGNGGSGATASHITGDFNKGLSLGQLREKRYKFISLVDNSPTLLSLANDVSYDDIFVEQLKNFINPGDLVIAISGSGNSENVLRAVNYAKEKGNKVIGFTGFDGGKLKQLSDVSVHIPLKDMQVVEDVHMMLGHLIFSVLYHGKY